MSDLSEIELLAIFIFYDISTGIQSSLSFSKEFKHCNIITYDGYNWVLLEFDKTGFITRVINAKSASSLLRGLRVMKNVISLISIAISNRKAIAWKPLWVRSCNEMCRYASGIDVGFTFNPIHLYYKLLKYNSKRNYKILTHWRR